MFRHGRTLGAFALYRILAPESSGFNMTKGYYETLHKMFDTVIREHEDDLDSTSEPKVHSEI